MIEYKIFYDGVWLATFPSNTEARRYIQELVAGRSIIGDYYQDPKLFRVTKDGVSLTVEAIVEIRVGGY